MLGAIFGDIVGSPYEFDAYNCNRKDFPLLCPISFFTDDTIVTLAVAKGVMQGHGNPDSTKKTVVEAMQKWGHAYPNAGYGGQFRHWLWTHSTEPYGSFGNGSAMRVLFRRLAIR